MHSIVVTLAWTSLCFHRVHREAHETRDDIHDCFLSMNLVFWGLELSNSFALNESTLTLDALIYSGNIYLFLLGLGSIFYVVHLKN